MTSTIPASPISKIRSIESMVPLLQKTAKYIRWKTIEMIYHANKDAPRRGHYGSSTSSIELCLMEIVRLVNPWNDFIAWKPHASPPIYALLYLLGEITLDDLKTLRRKDSPCQAYFNHWLTPLVQVSTGCMGFPLPFCCGRAMGDKIEGRNRRVFVNLGDAEFTMPMSVESLRFGKMMRLNNLGIIVDDNRQSMSGLTAHFMGDRPIEDYFRFFGWNVIITDGHDIAKLWDAFGDFEREMQVNERPTALVAKTDKWYGLPNPDSVGHHAHMGTFNEETYTLYRKENGFDNEEPFAPPSVDIQEFMNELSNRLKESTGIREKQIYSSISISDSIFLKDNPKSRSTLGAVQESFRHIVNTKEGRNRVLYIDPDLGKFPGLLPNFTGPNSVEGETYSIKNTNGYVIRPGLSDPFAVAISSGLGKDGERYPIIPVLDGFGLLISESVKQGSLSGSNFLILGIETNAWEGLTHQPGTSSNTVFRNLPYRPIEKWGEELEFGVYDYHPCHPKEAKLIFEDCIRNQRMAHIKLTAHQPTEKQLSWFDKVTDEEFIRGAYIVGSRYDTPDLVILSSGREVYHSLDAAEFLRIKYPKAQIQVGIITCLNLLISQRKEDKDLIGKIIPNGTTILRVAGLPFDALGISHGLKEKTLGTRYLTQSCSQDELEMDQGYDLQSIIKAGEELLISVYGMVSSHY